MAQDYSFDVVSQFARQELVNAVNQAQREIATRYDFKDTGATIELNEKEINLHGPSDFKMKAMLDVLQSKLVKRQLSLKILKPGPIEPAAKGTVRQKIELQEGIADELARELVKQIKQVSPKVQPRIQGDAIRVSSREKDLLQQVIQALKASEGAVPLQFINYRCVMDPDPELYALAERVGKGLRTRQQTVAVAESCTGGLLGGALTDVPGSSSYFLGGLIAYADQVKLVQLGVPASTLKTHGAVSAETAAAMAEGVRRLLRSGLGVSITGVAGPAAEDNKPAGLTFIGLADSKTTTHRLQWQGHRWENRRRSVLAALELLVRALEGMSCQ